MLPDVSSAFLKICCSVGLKGAVQRFGPFAELSSVQLSSEFLLFVGTLLSSFQNTRMAILTNTKVIRNAGNPKT